MIVEFTKRFKKDFRQIADVAGIASSLERTIDNVQNASTISEIKNLKKLSGYKIYFRIRIGDYRIGIKLDNDTVIFSTIQHRKNIYKSFP